MTYRLFLKLALAISWGISAQGALAGITSGLLLSPIPAPYAGQTVGTTSPPQAFVLTEAGGGGLSSSLINSITTTGDFARSGTCAAGTLLSSGASCTTPITFTPTAIGARTGSLVINCSVVAALGTVAIICNGVNQIVALSGTGLAAIGQQAPIPTLEQWAITAMAGFILVIAISALRKQRV